MRLQGPAFCGGLSHGGVAYTPDADGCINVPDDDTEAIAAALSHGFAVAVEQDEPKPKRRRKEP